MYRYAQTAGIYQLSHSYGDQLTKHFLAGNGVTCIDLHGKLRFAHPQPMGELGLGRDSSLKFFFFFFLLGIG